MFLILKILCLITNLYLFQVTTIEVITHFHGLAYKKIHETMFFVKN